MKGLRYTTAGESHGPRLVGILEGLPAGLELSLERIDAELARRQGGYGRSARQTIERDRVEVLGGIRAGLTLGAPLALSLANRDASIESLPVPGNARPGHADLAGCQKLGQRDPRAVLERASARETAMRVALGSAARQLLEAFGVEIFAHVVELGGVRARADAFDAAGARRGELRGLSAFQCVDPDAEAGFRAAVDRAMEERDSLGGVFELQVLGLPPGLGGYANPSERLTARLGGALLSIPAMKGVEFGLGFEAARRPGSAVHDPIVLADKAPPLPHPWRYGRLRRASNRAGGLEGGMSTGEPLVARVAMKPIPTLRRGVESVDFASGDAVRATYQRSDVTSVPAASVVGEAVAALELAGAFLEKFAGDHLAHTRAAFAAWCAEVEGL
ncbi:MAG: chorismate synthase [Planctomycetaceae bacterium]|nr:chorismate synthase [Planctomycetaceae bacterium]